MKTTSKRTGKTIDIDIIHCGLIVDDNLWQCDKWSILFKTTCATVDYFTGLGHRRAKTRYYEEFKQITSKQFIQTRENLIKVKIYLKNCIN